MIPTPRSLLMRLCATPTDPVDWRRFHDLYRPLLAAWLRGRLLQSHDVDDLVQEVLVVVLRELPGFTYDPARGRFRTWLQAILVNRLREFARRPRSLLAGGGGSLNGLLDQLEDPNSDLTRQWDRDHNLHVVERLLAMVRGDFEPTTWEAFQLCMADEKPAAIAARLGVSVNAVYSACSRVLRRLREESGGLID